MNGQRPAHRIIFFDRNHVERGVANLKAGRPQILRGLDVAPRFGSGDAKISDLDVV